MEHGGLADSWSPADITLMVNPTVGSIWTVPHTNGVVLVTAGPFGAAERPEYIVTPLYDRSALRWVRTQLDVLIEPHEGPFDHRMFASVWNARPALAADLELCLGTASTQATEAVRDVYWTTLNGERLPADRRLGKNLFLFLRGSRMVRFQERELRRWQALSRRIWRAASNSVTNRSIAPTSQPRLPSGS